MNTCRIFYSDTIPEAASTALALSKILPGAAVPAGEQREHLIYESATTIGFVLCSVKGNPPRDIMNVIRRLVADKKSYFFLLIPGGRHQLACLCRIEKALAERGMKLSHACTEYSLKKLSLTDENVLETVAQEIRNKDRVLEHKKSSLATTPKPLLRKALHKNMKEYKRIMGTGTQRHHDL